MRLLKSNWDAILYVLLSPAVVHHHSWQLSLVHNSRAVEVQVAWSHLIIHEVVGRFGNHIRVESWRWKTLLIGKLDSRNMLLIENHLL